MFYQGALQDGISVAVSQQKPVLCFVTDGKEESQKWETEYLQDDALAELIRTQAVALRLAAGSEEAGYLAQIFPLPQTPTVVIMRNGELKEYIIPGLNKEEFIRRVQKAFSAPTEVLSSSNAESAPSTAPVQSPATPAPPAPQAPAATNTSDNVRRVVAERAQRLLEQRAEAERKAKEARAEAEAVADAEAARAHKQAELVKKKRQQDAEERQRILKRIEDDRAERRSRAMEREKEKIENQSAGDVTSAPSTTRIGAMTAIQVRLMDGSTMRSRFKTDATAQEVRKWVDENRTGEKQPYTFKHLLTPLPNKNIDATEEDKSLVDLGLAPSATLILIPVQNYTSAYEGGGSSNPISGLLAFIMGFFTWFLGLFGLGGRAPEPANSTPDVGQAPTQGRSRIHGVRNPVDRQRDQQLYNGNSLNFEPRPDDEEEKQ
ncbi:ubiquitin-related domain-containing protein [Stachybotrys elegans]|uniref:UBX domain-containing protein 2 n=1 Tax=Stachybotrys elegans TaxID=80388 RepID=A0A8K0SCR7_9HYPO|nr:ubiquitin-related domain-containing protein [Stachybotrys elegans]